MGEFLTAASRIEQLSRKGMYKLLDNELYKDDDGAIYLVWRGFETDNFTWINSGDYDIRCSHLHDEGCKYHQIIRLRWFVNESFLKQNKYLRVHNGKMVCEDIPRRLLMVMDVSGHWINNLFYRMLKAADCPKTPRKIQLLYRAGVSLNFGWFKSGKEKINLNRIYEGKGSHE